MPIKDGAIFAHNQTHKRVVVEGKAKFLDEYGSVDDIVIYASYLKRDNLMACYERAFLDKYTEVTNDAE